VVLLFEKMESLIIVEGGAQKSKRKSTNCLNCQGRQERQELKGIAVLPFLPFLALLALLAVQALYNPTHLLKFSGICEG
jgi:hypothetical protein